jgi:hypothetical protein
LFNFPTDFSSLFQISVPLTESARAQATTITVPLLLGMAFAYVSTAFASGIVKEKENRAKHQQVYSSLLCFEFTSTRISLLYSTVIYYFPIYK